MGRSAAGVGRERIVEAALELFATDGVAATSLQSIADHLGITKAAIYHHFRAKDLIVVEVLRVGLAQLDEVVTVAMGVDDPDRRAEIVVRGLADIMAANRRRYSIMMGDPAVGPALEADPHTASIFARMEDMLLGPQPTAERRLAVAFFLTACNAPARPSLRDENSIGSETIHAAVIALGHHLLARPSEHR